MTSSAQIAGAFRVMRKVHGEAGASLRAAAQIGGVTEHLRQRNFARESRSLPARDFRALNLAAPRIQVAENRRHVFFGNDHFHPHDGLEQTGLAFAQASLNAIEPAILKAISELSTSW